MKTVFTSVLKIGGQAFLFRLRLDCEGTIVFLDILVKINGSIRKNSYSYPESVNINCE